jgi:hypothetical protein
MTNSSSLLPYRLPSRGLPLTAFEEHMLLDDRPSHPMAIITRFDFTDAPPPDNLEEAFQTTLTAEPLLTAQVSARRGGRPRWIEASRPRLHRSRTPRIASDMVEWTGSLPRLDPATGSVLHAEVIEHDAGWSILLAVHHAACDGLGIVGFLERWLLAVEGKRGRWRRQPAATMAALTSRGRIATSWPEFIRLLPKLAKGLEGVGEFMRHDVIELSDAVADRLPDSASASPAPWQPLVLSVTVNEEVVAGLETTAKAHSVSVNDLLATALLVTIGAHVSQTETDWIRVGIPVSLRTKNDHVLPAANRVGMVFLDRQPDDRHDRIRLAATVRDQMAIIRSHSLGHIFPMSLEVGRLLPGGLARTATRPKPQCTAVLSNVGRCFRHSPLADADGVIRVGGGRMTGWWGVPPIRPGTALAVGTHETSGRRTIAFHVDRQRFAPEAAQTLLHAMASEVTTLAAMTASAPKPMEVS